MRGRCSLSLLFICQLPAAVVLVGVRVSKRARPPCLLSPHSAVTGTSMPLRVSFLAVLSFLFFKCVGVAFFLSSCLSFHLSALGCALSSCAFSSAASVRFPLLPCCARFCSTFAESLPPLLPLRRFAFTGQCLSELPLPMSTLRGFARVPRLPVC
ncbi:hypothetical protein TRVL_08773 [Trypanosoma vivax]|nr:hypothetical protein TRVL_08773 [Trypanosoma vivax]